MQSSSSGLCRRVFAKSRLNEKRLAGKLPLSLRSIRKVTSLFHRPLPSPSCRPKSRSLCGAVSTPWRCVPLIPEGDILVPMSNVLSHTLPIRPSYLEKHITKWRLSASFTFSVYPSPFLSVTLSRSLSLCLCLKLQRVFCRTRQRCFRRQTLNRRSATGGVTTRDSLLFNVKSPKGRASSRTFKCCQARNPCSSSCVSSTRHSGWRAQKAGSKSCRFSWTTEHTALKLLLLQKKTMRWDVSADTIQKISTNGPYFQNTNGILIHFQETPSHSCGAWKRTTRMLD